MFWKYNTPASSQIDSLLAKEDVTLQEVMDSEDIISECRVQNKNLIDFLLKTEVIEELVTLTTKEPSLELNEKTRFKYPNVASELLTCDVPAINERLAGDERLLEKLYVFLENEPPLNPLLASYFSKIMGALIAKKTEQNWLSYQFTCLQVLDFLKARESFLPLLIKHLGTSAIMDLMLKLMTQVEGVEMRQNILNWLDSQRIIQQLISLLNPKIEKERHDNVAQLLCDFVRIARDNQRNSIERADPDPLLNTLESSDTVSLLLDQIFEGEKLESSIVGGIQVLLALLDVNQISTTSIYNTNINDEAMDMEQKQRIILNITEAITNRLKDFHALLLSPPKQPSLLTTIGQLEPPLGNTRLQVIKLLAAIIPSNYTKLYNELISIGTFPVLLDLFFRYAWNNFLHTQVENCLTGALKLCSSGELSSATSDALSRHLLDSCNLIETIIKAWKENDEQQAEGKNIRRGYMGHLISLLNKVVEMCASTSLGQLLKDEKPETAKSLDEFKETTLAEVNETQERLLAGAHPNTSIEDNDEFGDIPFPQSTALQQQMYSQYQMQNLTSQYIDGYSGFNDDAFNDGDDTLQTIDNPSDVNFDLSESDMVQRDDIFKQVCAQSINTLFDADDQIFEEKDHTFQTVIEKQGDKNDAVYSSDSDEGSPSGDDNMEVDPWSSPKPDPWGALATTTTGESMSSSDWADFSAASFSQGFTTFENSKNKKEQESQPSIKDQSKSDQKLGSSEVRAFSEVSKKEIPSASSDTEPTKGASEDKDSEKSSLPDTDSTKVAASGDHSESKDNSTEKKEGSENEQQPSISLGGDSCNLPEISQASPEKPKPDQLEKV